MQPINHFWHIIVCDTFESRTQAQSLEKSSFVALVTPKFAKFFAPRKCYSATSG